VNPVRARRRSCIRLLERFAGARSHPVQACATTALLASIRQDALQLIRPWRCPAAYAHADESPSRVMPMMTAQALGFQQDCAAPRGRACGAVMHSPRPLGRVGLHNVVFDGLRGVAQAQGDTECPVWCS
jgi:hypothetical protein